MSDDPNPVDPEDLLAADDLGAAAEYLFANLCARARLVCNKSDRDRAGWDFVIDFPLPAAGTGVLLDQRQKTRCNVQLKATASVGSSVVSLKLSAADLLAKDPQPAFLVVFRLRRDGTPLKGYLIHLLNEPLAKVLRRLREAEARGRNDTQNLKITFDYRRLGRSFALTPQALRQTLEDACGGDSAAYVRDKLRQLEELGYEHGHIVGNAWFQVESDDHLSRILLGVEPLRPAHLEAFDVRFGIPIPYASDLCEAVQEIMLSPPTAGACTIAISGPPLAPAATFAAELFFAPPFDGGLRMLIRHPDITFTFRETRVAIEADGVFSDRPRTLAETTMLMRALSYLASGAAVVSLTGADGSFGPIRTPLSSPLTGPYLESLPALARFAHDWQRLLEMAGVRSVAKLTMDDLWDGNRAGLAADMVLNPAPVAQFAFDSENLPASGDRVTAIYFDSCSVAGEGISYSVEVTLEPSDFRPGVYRSTTFRPLEVRPMVADLNEYMDELVERFGASVMIHPDNVRQVEPAELEGPQQDRLA
ncbi:hypothetical protein [Sphingomonas sp. CARO-RG-8B-R24-01]|uniref:hypothetical protein n=1 Tax=Sphingomonas sp. CARO-RG-8B-R24-01 TaxID=2914831 RepID=UPI001F5925B1|nr:hypothetical protein [Sphingomonas sp. CARO-RG-8B-R24-01]